MYAGLVVQHTTTAQVQALQTDAGHALVWEETGEFNSLLPELAGRTPHFKGWILFVKCLERSCQLQTLFVVVVGFRIFVLIRSPCKISEESF